VYKSKEIFEKYFLSPYQYVLTDSTCHYEKIEKELITKKFNLSKDFIQIMKKNSHIKKDLDPFKNITFDLFFDYPVLLELNAP